MRSGPRFAIACVVASTAAVAVADDPGASKEAAKEHFDRGLALFEEEAWDAALVEFQQSRALYPTRNATRNAAVCLRMLRRYDEALEVFEALLHDFPDLGADARAFAEKEIASLNGLVGRIEVRGAEAGASIVVDTRARTTVTSVAPAPFRASAGAHVLRVVKDGFVPFEAEVTVVAGQTSVIEVKLKPVEKGGKLRVVEASGRAAVLRVDNVVVGKVPWEGTLPAGDHTVSLDGDGNLGTQPARTSVVLGQLTPLTVTLEELDARLRVQPTPVIAHIAIDGVVVGRGIWEGKLRSGAHRLEIDSTGYLPTTRQLTLAKGERLVLPIELERDSSVSLSGEEAKTARRAWLARRGGQATFELRGHGNVFVMPFTDERAGSETESISRTTGQAFHSNSVSTRRYFGGGGAGGVGVRVGYLYLDLADPEQGNLWTSLRITAGVDVNFGYYNPKGQVVTAFTREQADGEAVDQVTQYGVGAWGSGWIIELPLTLGYMLGIGSYKGTVWEGVALGIAYAPAWVIYAHSRFPAKSELNLAGFEVSIDFLQKPMESKGRSDHPRVFVHTLLPHGEQSLLLTIGGGVAWY